MNCYSIPLRCFKKVILRLCENSDLIYEIFTLGKRGVTPTLCKKFGISPSVSQLLKKIKANKVTRGPIILRHETHYKTKI